jgi:hypothetical protein
MNGLGEEASVCLMWLVHVYGLLRRLTAGPGHMSDIFEGQGNEKHIIELELELNVGARFAARDSINAVVRMLCRNAQFYE